MPEGGKRNGGCMKKVVIISSVVIISILIASIMILDKMDVITANIVGMNMTCPKQICDLKCPNVEVPSCQKCPDLPTIFVHAKMVAESNDYKKGLYDCTQYSKELFRRYENDGYRPQFCIGYLDGEKHDWVKLGRRTVIEATTGWFVPPYYYEKHYREIGCWSHIPVGA